MLPIIVTKSNPWPQTNPNVVAIDPTPIEAVVAQCVDDMMANFEAARNVGSNGRTRGYSS